MVGREVPRKRKVSYAQCIGTIRKHIIGSTLGARRLVDVTAGHVEAFLEEKSADFSAETLNHLRGYLGRAFTMARRAKRFVGPNPVSDVPKRKVPHRLPDYLRPEEVVAVLANVPPKWRCLFATALYTGMRKGELLGLRKEDVDLSARLITIRRSHDRDTTKGGHADAIPIAAELAPYLGSRWPRRPRSSSSRGRDGRLLSRQSAARAGPAARASAREHPDRLSPHVPAPRVRPRRAGARRRAPPVPEVPDEALAGRRRCGRSGSITSATRRRRCS